MPSYPTRDYSSVAEFVPFKPKPAAVRRRPNASVTNNQPARPRPHSLIYADMPRSWPTSSRTSTTSPPVAAVMYRLKQEVEKQRELIARLSERLSVAEDLSAATISASPTFGVSAVEEEPKCSLSEDDVRETTLDTSVDTIDLIFSDWPEPPKITETIPAHNVCNTASDMVALSSFQAVEAPLTESKASEPPMVVVTSPTMEDLCGTDMLKGQSDDEMRYGFATSGCYQ
jgi:Rad3-related DNA helicase